MSRGGVPVDVDVVERRERAHREHAGRMRPLRPAEREREGEPAALREAGEDRLVAGEAVLGALRVDEVVERVERGLEARRRRSRRAT